MKAITLTQPWASLVAAGHKKIETRSWRTAYRGPLAIHAAGIMPKIATAFANRHARFLPEELPLRAIVAVADLFDVHQVHSFGQMQSIFSSYGAPYEYEFGDYTPGRYAWVMRNIRPLANPVYIKGHLGLWEWTAGDLLPV